MSKIGTINTTGTIFKPTITSATYDELMAMINTPLNVNNALIFSVPQNNGEDINGEGSIWMTDGDGYLYPMTEPINKEAKTFELPKIWYDKSFNIKTSENKDHIIYSINSDEIYSKPIYLKPGKYILTIYINTNSIPSDNYCLRFYGNKYPSNLSNESNVSFNMTLSSNTVRPISNSNEIFYEYSGELNLRRVGFYSLNIFNNQYKIYIP